MGLGQSVTPLLAIGVGCRAGVAGEAVAALVARARAGLDVDAPARLFTVTDKRGEPGLEAAALALGLDLVFLSHGELAAVAGAVVTPSPASMARFALPSIAEAAALAGAGPGARLLVPRIAGGGVTCAIAGQPTTTFLR